MGKDLQLSENPCTMKLMKVFPLEYFAVYGSMEHICRGVIGLWALKPQHFK